jgi:hypothetical protein
MKLPATKTNQILDAIQILSLLTKPEQGTSPSPPPGVSVNSLQVSAQDTESNAMCEI